MLTTKPRFPSLLTHVGVFLLFFGIFLVAQFSIGGLWSPDDGYYHAKHAWLMAESGNPTLVEPWIAPHWLTYAPADPWWGFHVLQSIPMHWLDPITSTKIVAAALAALMFLVLFSIFKAERVPRAFWWTALLLISSRLLLMRLLFERPHLVALSFLPLAYWLTMRHKYYWLFGLTLLYTLLYNLAPIMPLMIMGYVIIDGQIKNPMPFPKYFTRQINLKPIIATGTGLLAGLLIHPNSQNYIYIISLHLWQILSLRLQGVRLNFGSEIQTISFTELFYSNAPIIILYLLIIAAVIATRSSHARAAWHKIYTLGVLSGGWFLLMIPLPRAIEYWAPLAWLFIILAGAQLLRTETGQIIRAKFIALSGKKIPLVFLSGFFIIMIMTNVQLLNAYRANHQSLDDDHPGFRAAAAWLNNHTPKHSIVFYPIWSYWPPMFFYNNHNRYLTGMDPTFLYEYSPSLYWLWNNISTDGTVCDQASLCPETSPRWSAAALPATLRNNFNADYVLIKIDPENLFFRLLDQRTRDFSKVYSNEQVAVYQIL